MSTERQQLLALHLGKCTGCAVTLPHNRAIGRLSRQKLLQQHRHYVLKMSVNRASTTFALVSWKILGLCGGNEPIITLSAAFLGKNGCDYITTMS
jgi:hypothetical protein